MDASELGRWTRFAAKGGIGKCTAIQDCVAEKAEDLMFLKVSCLTLSSPHSFSLVTSTPRARNVSHSVSANILFTIQLAF